MSDYIFIVRKKDAKKATYKNQTVTVNFAKFLCKDNESDYNKPNINKALESAYNHAETDKAEFITFGKANGAEVYKNNNYGVFDDSSGFWSGINQGADIVGHLQIKNGAYFIATT